MKVTPTALSEVLLIEPTVFSDDRGFFYESFNAQAFQHMTGCVASFVQDNHSRSHRGVLRGLHYQLPPYAQGKLVRVVQGAVWDVVVDIRASSPTVGQWVGELLSADNHKQLWIPPGFAHGFVVLSDSADTVYKVTSAYAPHAERGVAWNDPELCIGWPDLGMDFIVSDKDAQLPFWGRAELA